MTRRRSDFGLYLVTDRPLCCGRQIEEVVSASVNGGVTAVQLREKNCSTREYIQLARNIKKILEPFAVPLIVNDRVDVALAVGADGVHIGQSDMPYRDVRRLMGSDAIIGVSVETREQAMEAEDWEVDYLGVSPILSTPTKTDTATAWGIEGLCSLRLESSHLLVAIGGINSSNAASVLEAGADGIAVVSAICSAENPEEASRRLRAIVEHVREERKR